MRAVMKGECDGSGAVHKGGVGIVGGLGARRNATAAGGVAREGGRRGVGESVWRFERCGAV
jgi:hypothetical protein